MTSSWFFLSTLNYDARSTTHQIYKSPCLTFSVLMTFTQCPIYIMYFQTQVVEELKMLNVLVYFGLFLHRLGHLIAASNFHLYFYRCTMHFDIYKVHTPTNALFIKPDKVLKFTLKITLNCSSCLKTKICRSKSM